MNFKGYKIIPNFETLKMDLFLTTKDEILKCEREHNFHFDKDYIEYVLTYGNGILGGTYIRIYLPNRILKTLPSWRERIDNYWLWKEGEVVLKKEQVLNSVRIGDTFDGDEIIIYESNYYVLLRHSNMIYKLGNTLEMTINWLCSSGILTDKFIKREFEPFKWEEQSH